MIRSLPIPKLAVFEKLNLQNQSYTKIMREQERNVISFTGFAKIWAEFGKNFPFYMHFAKKAYFRILQVILDAVSNHQRSGNQRRPTTCIFEKGELFAFRGSDECHFNVIELTNPIDVDKITPRSKVKGNILTTHSDDGEVCCVWAGKGMGRKKHAVWVLS